MIDFNDLRFFAAVVSNHGFSAAGRALGVPKSRVSRRVQLLEAHLGVRLLDRSTRRLGVTEAGRQVFEHARAAVVEAEAVEEVALRMRAEPRGLVRLSCPIGVQGVLAERFPAFLARHPLLRVQCMVTNRRVDLINEGVDLAVRVRERLDTDADLQMKRIGAAASILVASPGFLSERGTPTGPAEIGAFPLLSLHEAQGPFTWNLTGPSDAFVVAGAEARLAAGSFEMLLHAAVAGLGIALLPTVECRAALQSGALVHILPQWRGVEGVLHIVFPSRRGMLPSVRAVLDFAADALRAAAVDTADRPDAG